MNLEILSLSDAKKFVPKDRTYAIRIYNSIPEGIIFDFEENKNWVKVNKYYFNDGWPESWEEYSWIDKEDPYFNGLLLDSSWSELKEMYPEMTKESLMSYFESEGHPKERGDLFNETFAKKILSDFEEYKDKIDTLMVHCSRGQNRSPAIGIAMNEIYGWGIKGLKEKFPWYRRYVYDIMMKIY